jgi:hypothetical protein
MSQHLPKGNGGAVQGERATLATRLEYAQAEIIFIISSSWSDTSYKIAQIWNQKYSNKKLKLFHRPNILYFSKKIKSLVSASLCP